RQYSELQAKFQAQEDEIVKLKDRVKVLEDKEGVYAKQSGDDAPIKGRSINEGEAAAERIINDSKEIARVLTSIDAATVLAGGIDVPTGKNMRMNEQIARDAEVARIHAEEELQEMIDSLDQSNETIAKYLQEYQDFASELPLEKRIELISDLVENFIPMGSKEETKRLKRKGLNLEKEQVKKQKSSEEAHEIEISTEEFTEEKMKEMIQLVPVEDVYVQALQVKHPIINWKVYTEDLLKQLDREDLNQLWALVKEYLSIRPATNDKEMERSIKFRRGFLGIKCTRHSHCQVKCSHWQYKFPLPAKVVATTRRLKMPLPEVCTAIEEKKKKLQKCYADEPLAMSLEGIHVDNKLSFVEEPVEIMEQEIKQLKQSRIPRVKVRWNSRRGPELTRERKDSFKQKYP
nr:putative reverse transcriptase domain-containing protein [Tanacetum cinerariifolium]